MTRQRVGMAKIKERFGWSRDKVLRNHSELSFPIHKDKPTGHWYGYLDEMEEWETKRRSITRQQEIRQKSVGPSTLAKEASDDIRSVMFYGREPTNSSYWRNAKFVRSDLPADIVAGFDLNSRASFEIAVEHADKLLSLPLAKQAEAMKAIAARLAAFHGEEVR